MFKKLIDKIKIKLRIFLEVESLENKLNLQQKRTEEKFNVQLTKTRSINYQLNENRIKMNSLHETLSNIVSVGSDIVPNGRGNSWAVVCIEGNYNVVKFFDLSHKDGREMLRVLKAFEGGRYVNDTPIGFIPKECFINWQE